MSISARRLQRVQQTASAPPVTGTYSTEVMADSPQIYYPMQERAGAIVAIDASGNNKNAAYQGPVGIDHAWNPYQFAPVALGRNISLGNAAGNTQYIQLPASSINVTNGLTFEAWIQPFGWGWETSVFNFGDDIALIHGNYGAPTFNLWVQGSSFTLADCGDNAWHHLVVTVPAGGGTGKVYYDGSLAASGAVGTLTQQTRAEMYIGRASGGSNNYFNGFVTQAAVYGTALSAARVLVHYNAGQMDADPVWHGTDEWSDLTYFNQFSGGATLANVNYVATADWMPPTMYNAADVSNMHPYMDVGIAPPSNSDYSWYRDNSMYVMPGGPSAMVGTRGTETIGYGVDDEPDMSGQEGLLRMTNALASVPAGFMGYVNFGTFITLGQGDPTLTQGQFTNAPGLELQSVDLYWYSLRDNGSTTADEAWGILQSQLRRACNYGATIERARSTFDQPRPQWGFVELAHPYTELNRGGPNPDQVEGAVWSNIIGGARGIIWFHHSFSPGDPPAWNASATYQASDCVLYAGEYYYAALTPAVGQTPTLSSYTWVRWSGNSGAGLDNTTVRHPDLPARLVKIKADLQTMAPAINSPTTMHLLHGDLYSTYRPNAHDGNKYIFAVPGLNAPNGGTFQMYLPQGQNPASIEVVGESRSITPSAGRFTDTFATEASHHIYRWV